MKTRIVRHLFAGGARTLSGKGAVQAIIKDITGAR